MTAKGKRRAAAMLLIVLVTLAMLAGLNCLGRPFQQIHGKSPHASTDGGQSGMVRRKSMACRLEGGSR